MPTAYVEEFCPCLGGNGPCSLFAKGQWLPGGHTVVGRQGVGAETKSNWMKQRDPDPRCCPQIPAGCSEGGQHGLWGLKGSNKNPPGITC